MLFVMLFIIAFAITVDGSVLRSVDEVEGYSVITEDGEDVANVSDFIFDDELWTVRYLVINENGPGGKNTLVSPAWIDEVDWVSMDITVDFTEEQFYDAPAYELQTPVDRDFEIILYDFYDYDPYW